MRFQDGSRCGQEPQWHSISGRPLAIRTLHGENPSSDGRSALNDRSNFATLEADSAASKRATHHLYVPALLFVVCLAAQLYLVFIKSFNWDEFLHFSEVYQLRVGTLIEPFQTVHLRMLWWAPEVARNLVGQMLAARLFIWLLNLLTLSMICGVARRFVDVVTSFFAAFAYLVAGYVFTQSFSIRGDPIVAATLLFALFLMTRGSLSLMKAIAVGALIGLAGMMTFKAAFYAPCFAGLLWLEFRETPKKRQFLGRLVVLAIVTLLSFAAVYLLHTSGLAEAPQRLRNPSSVSFYLRWLTTDLPFAGYIGREVTFAPLFFLCVALVPFAWKKAGLNADAKPALAGFVAPLAVLLFYRNTFPYFFVFILAPVAIAIAPVLGLVRKRYGNAFLAVLLSAIPLAMTVLEPRYVIGRQRALIDYVHREFPGKTGYLDYSAMIADYPRVIDYLTSGNGIRLYHETGDPVVGREIDRGNVPFIIANQGLILAALQGQPVPDTFLPTDLAAITGNYVQQWGVLWREGKQIPAGTGAYEFQLRRGGNFVLDGGALTIDGVARAQGARIRLNEGHHVVNGGRNAASTLWRGDRLPAPPPNIPMDFVFTDF